MAREERMWHPRFIKYMEMIANHPNYKGLRIDRKPDGSFPCHAVSRYRKETGYKPLHR